MNHAADHIDVIPDDDSAAVRGRMLRAIAIVALSAVVSFATVRVWRGPVRTAGLVPARVSVDTEPPGAELFIDDQAHGATPQTLSLDPGAHTFLVRAAGTERAVR